MTAFRRTGNDALASHAASGVGSVVASGPHQSLWLRILLRCLVVTAVPLVIVIGIAALLASGWGALSALLGGAVVLVFFALSLLVGHFFGRNESSTALGVFVVGYAVKVIGCGAALMLIDVPVWLDRTWFMVAALVAVLLWQGTEVVVFSRTRRLVFGGEEDAAVSHHG
ncbi:hypothetical protein [Psychromicrobium xiongbiense]|uniref:hypothetical protein n=1 Tax=Psychromicrobium xiongbiense TaxID=3051184 RepID=UPI002553166A|nr:hypothetical protein [Psychromicrobium sp. YIM S02556]